MAETVETEAGKSHTMDFSEIAAQAASSQAPDYSQVKFEGDGVPEIVRGKTAAETLALISGMQESLRLSEQARAQALATATALAERPAASAPAPVQQIVAEPADPTEAELKAIYDEDPFKYHQTVAQITERRMMKQLNSTVQPLMGSTASAAEQAARAKYKDEFDILGKEIDHIIQTELGGNRAVMAQPEAWDRLIKYARGEHIDKFVSEKAKRSSDANLATSRQREVDSAPADFTGKSGESAPRQRGKLKELDATQKEICRVQGISEADYIQYYVG